MTTEPCPQEKSHAQTAPSAEVRRPGVRQRPRRGGRRPGGGCAAGAGPERLGLWSKDRDADERREDVEALAQAGAEEVREQVAEVVGETITGPPEVQQAVAT